MVISCIEIVFSIYLMFSNKCIKTGQKRLIKYIISYRLFYSDHKKLNKLPCIKH